MAYSEEITAKLGLDTNSFKQGLEQAKESFRKAGKEMGHSAGGHGENAGKAFAHGLEHHLFGTRKLSGALVAAIGLEDFKEVGAKIASYLTGGTAEAWKEVGKIQEQITELIDRRNKARLSDTQQIVKLEREIAYLESQKEGASQRSYLKRGSLLSTLMEAPTTTLHRAFDKSQNSQTAEESLENEERKKKVLEDQIELEEKQKKGREDLKRVEEDSAEYRAKKKTGQEAIVELVARENEIFASMAGKELSDGDRAKKNAEILKIEKDIDEARAKIAENVQKAAEKKAHATEEEVKRQRKLREEQEDEASAADRLLMLRKDLLDATEAAAKAKKDDLNYQELLNEKVEAQLRLVKEVREQQKEKLTKDAEAERKTSDDDKLSLNELASHDAFETGINVDVRNQSATAREVLQLRSQAEEARKMGNSDESAELRQKAESLTSGLSTLKDSEKTPTAAFKEALKDTNTKLDSIDTILKGKFVSQ